VTDELSRLLAAGSGLIRRRDHPELGGQLDWACRTGELLRVLPGVYAVPEVAAQFEGRVRAAARWRPDAVITGRSAARLTFWPTMAAPVVDLSQVERRRGLPGFSFSERRVPPELRIERGPLHLTCPALTALDLCVELGGDPLDVVLRGRRATLAGLHRALELSPDRSGNRRRRRLLLDSRDEPWSAAERLAHAILREAGITGWRSNHPVLVGGHRYYLDVAFPEARLVIEIDGREFHADAAAFEADRHRQNALVAAGWRVLRLTWRMLVDDPAGVVELVRRELDRRRLGRRSATGRPA
jgi:very-short-patch-repair endonuclease